MKFDGTTRDWLRVQAGVDGLFELLKPVVPARLRITDTEIVAFDGDGKRIGMVVWATGGRESIGHAEVWDPKLNCDRTARVAEISTI